MKRIAIIGSKGYIGKHLQYYLKGLGHSVMGYDIVPCDEADYIQCDLTDVDSVSKIDTEVDLIFMFAGLTGTYAGFDKAQTYMNVNELALINLLNHIRQSSNRPKVIFPSTRLVYKGAEKPLKEEDEKEAKTIYAVNKLACENILYAYRNSFGIPYTIFRICLPFGNMLSNDYSFGTVGFFIRQARDNGMITLYGNGTQKRTFTSMRNLCEQIVSASLLEESDGEVYNVGGRTYSLHSAAELIAAHYSAEVASIPWPEKDLKIESGSTYFNSSKIEDLLGGLEYEDLECLF